MRVCEICDDQEYYTLCNDCDADCCFDCIGHCGHCGRLHLCNEKCGKRGDECSFCVKKKGGCNDCMELCEFCESFNHKTCIKEEKAYKKMCGKCSKKGCPSCLFTWDEDDEENVNDKWIHEVCIEE